uniref:Uncharacterized protein n=1 Tax=Anguilla anguilla TaxID=7936 RepID=A0A0E9U4X4_ANGAN
MSPHYRHGAQGAPDRAQLR